MLGNALFVRKTSLEIFLPQGCYNPYLFLKHPLPILAWILWKAFLNQRERTLTWWWWTDSVSMHTL